MKPNILKSKATRNNNVTALVFGLIAGALALPSVAANEPADSIYLSRHIITMAGDNAEDEKREAINAIAVRGERIVWTGNRKNMTPWLGKETEVINFGNKAILPGFIDAHGHVSFSALASTLANVASPPVGPVKTMADLNTTLRAYITEQGIAPGGWVVGMGYDDSLIEEQRHPTRGDLDRVSTDHPIMLIHVSGHLIAANSRALAMGGITANSPDPRGGIIRRQPGTQEPDGVLEETATYALRKFMTVPNKNPLASLTETLSTYASYGITTVQDGAANPDIMNLLKAAADTNRLTLDVIAYPVGQVAPTQVIKAYPWGEYQGRFKAGGVKLLLDGSPQGKTAYLSKPYHVAPPSQDKDYAGYPTIDQSTTDQLIRTYIEAGISILAHANGDAAAQMLIDAVERAQSSSDHRTVMIHAQTVREDQLTRMKTLGIVPSYFSAHTFYWGDWHRDSVLGPVRGARISPTASTVSRGMPFTIHNDAPIVPPDMIRLLWATTNRKTRSGQVLGPEQRISIYDALKGMTIYAAYQHFEEQDKGTLEPGKLADMVVLSSNPLQVNPPELLRLKVMATYARGAQVYAREGS